MKKVKETPAPDNKFLGEAKVGKLLRMFAIPCVLALVVQALYNIVDQLFIGNCPSLGELGNTATGLIYPLTVIAYAIGQCIGDGVAACMSINQGKNDNRSTHKAVGTSLGIGLVLSLVLMGVCFAILNPFLDFLQGGVGASNFAREYSTWIFIGFPFYILGTIINPIIRADGSPKFAMVTIASGAIINIILDAIFIFGLNLGMNGAALATCLGQIFTFVLSVAYFFKSKTFRLKLQSFLPDFKIFWLAVKLGISSFLTQISIAIISIVTNKMLGIHVAAGELSESVVGFLTIAFKVFGIVVSVAIGVAAGGQPILGYNYGAKKHDRVKQTYKLIMLVTLVVGVVATLLFELCPQLIYKMFSPDPVDTFSLNIFRIYMSLILLTCLTKAHAIFFQAIGQPVKAMTIAMCRDFLFLVPLTIALPFIGGVNLMLWAGPLADLLTTVVTVVFVIMFFVKLRAQSAPATTANTAIKPSKPGLIITIAREHGAGGHEIGLKLAEKLGIPFYDKEITMLAAQESGLAAEFIKDVKNKDSVLYDLYLSSQINQNALTAQAQILHKIAANGACVIVGRAAGYVLRELHPYKVFAYAPMDYKVSRIMHNYGGDATSAQADITKCDRSRARFYKAVTGQDWTDKNNYNLVVDSSIGVDKVVDMICAAIAGK